VYAILALLYLNGKEDKIASVREISAFSKTPETLLSKIMQAMKNAGLVAAVYGNHGGYRLERELSQINLLNLTEVLAGPVQVTECLEPGNETCPVKTNCSIIAPMNLLNQKIIHLFEETSLESLAGKRALP
jgi:Rrf2 family protein